MNETIRIVLQWDDAYGKSKNNYDLILFNEKNGEILDVSANEQNGNEIRLSTLNILLRMYNMSV